VFELRIGGAVICAARSGHEGVWLLLLLLMLMLMLLVMMMMVLLLLPGLLIIWRLSLMVSLMLVRVVKLLLLPLPLPGSMSILIGILLLLAVIFLRSIRMGSTAHHPRTPPAASFTLSLSLPMPWQAITTDRSDGPTTRLAMAANDADILLRILI
jgi:hypothetical protein